MEGTIDLETGDKATQSVSKPIECAKIIFVSKSRNARRLPRANIIKKEKKKHWLNVSTIKTARGCLASVF